MAAAGSGGTAQACAGSNGLPQACNVAAAGEQHGSPLGQ